MLKLHHRTSDLYIDLTLQLDVTDAQNTFGVNFSQKCKILQCNLYRSFFLYYAFFGCCDLCTGVNYSPKKCSTLYLKCSTCEISCPITLSKCTDFNICAQKELSWLLSTCDGHNVNCVSNHLQYTTCQYSVTAIKDKGNAHRTLEYE